MWAIFLRWKAEAKELVLVQKGRAGLYAELVKTRKSVPDFSPSGTTDKL